MEYTSSNSIHARAGEISSALVVIARRAECPDNTPASAAAAKTILIVR
jgi:hypothetical protein